MQRRTTARGLAASILAAATVVHSVALAQGESMRGATAEALFRDARRLMLAGQLAEACPKFAAAQKLDPTVGTALNLGDCFERAGRTASAWASFNEAGLIAARERDNRRAAEAARRSALLEGNLARLQLAAPQGGLVASTTIQLDEQPLDAAVIGTAIPVDPGTHTVVLTRAGAKWSATVTLPPHHITVTVKLTDPVSFVASTAPVAPPAPRGGARRILGVSIGVLGVAGVVVGSIFGVQAMSGISADGHCDALNHCDSTGRTLRLDAIRAGNVSTASFIAGGVALAGGVVLVLTAPSRAEPRAALRFTLGPAEAHLTGIW